MTLLSTGGACQCSEPVGTVPGSPGPIHSCHQSALLCQSYSHLSAPALPPATRAPHEAQWPCHTPCPPTPPPQPAFGLRDTGTPAASPNPESTPFILTPGLFCIPRGSSPRPGAQGLGWKPLYSHSRAPTPPDPLLLVPHPAAALPLFHQAKDCFLNKSKKLHFLLGKFILSHFISFPPIFFPNNVIK